jgi:hypothetical protein
MLITLGCLAPVLQERPTNQSKPVVEVQCGGDDNLTQAVCRNIYNELKSTPDFALTDDDDTGALIVSIPTNVHWKERGKRTRVFYVAEFLSNNKRMLGRKKGECWEDDLQTCTSQVLKQTRSAARKVKS